MAKPEVTIALDKAEVFYRLPAYASGVIPNDVEEFLNSVSRYASIQERELLESDRTKLHPINYHAIVRVTPIEVVGGASTSNKYEWLVYRRPSKTDGESRLAGNHSIGFGGHPDGIDVMYNDNKSINLLASMYLTAAREINEEIDLNVRLQDLKFQGLIYDPSNDVGRYHLGLFGIIFVPGDAEILSSEDQIVNPQFVDIETLATSDDYNFESWSQLVLQGYFSKTGQV